VAGFVGRNAGAGLVRLAEKVCEKRRARRIMQKELAGRIETLIRAMFAFDCECKEIGRVRAT